jgi:hypothetical protein
VISQKKKTMFVGGSVTAATMGLLVHTAPPAHAAPWDKVTSGWFASVACGTKPFGALINDNDGGPGMPADSVRMWHECGSVQEGFRVKVKHGYPGQPPLFHGSSRFTRAEAPLNGFNDHPVWWGSNPYELQGVCFGVKNNDNSNHNRWSIYYIGRGHTDSVPGCPPDIMGDFWKDASKN